jgi:hypothetical protein
MKSCRKPRTSSQPFTTCWLIDPNFLLVFSERVRRKRYLSSQWRHYMAKVRPVYCLLIFLSAFACLSPAAANATDSMIKRQLVETIAKVKTGKTLNDRTDAAYRLSELTDGIDSTEIDDSTLKQMVSLLHSSEDSVRAWVAGSLGNLGPRARTAAAATLLKLLPKADCLPGELTSASFIRLALERMGVAPPPPTACETDRRGFPTKPRAAVRDNLTY